MRGGASASRESVVDIERGGEDRLLRCRMAEAIRRRQVATRTQSGTRARDGRRQCAPHAARTRATRRRNGLIMTALVDKHAVVTGGGSGIGASCAEALARAGARITLMGRDIARLEAQRDAMRSYGDVACISVDVTSETAVKEAFMRAGPVDVLVNNAGHAQAAPFTHTDAAL